MKKATLFSAALFSLSLSGAASAQSTLIIDSWRTDDKAWNEKIIPAFNRLYPDIKVIYRSPADGDASKWNGEMKARFANNTAGDLIACRPFDGSLDLYNRGLLKEVTEMPGMENFPSFAQGPWQTDSGAVTFCLPMASVIHGFLYNKDIFEEIGVKKPVTKADFYWVLEKAKRAGYLPLAIGSQDKWEAATMGFQNIGPNNWKGEDGRDELLTGSERFDSKPYETTFKELAKWVNYMGDDHAQRGYNDSIEAFASGKAAVYPTGSWDIMTFEGKVNLGVFPPPVEKSGDACYFTDHTDLGMGIYSKSRNSKAAEAFLEWMTTAEFAELLTNEISGFFSLSNHFFEVNDPIAQEMVSWRDKCDSTIRNTAQILSRGEPNLELEIWEMAASVIKGEISPSDATKRLQDGLSQWYEPQKTRPKSDTSSS